MTYGLEFVVPVLIILLLSLIKSHVYQYNNLQESKKINNKNTRNMENYIDIFYINRPTTYTW